MHGPAIGILEAERTALNFVQRLSGIATLTRRYCDAVRGTRAQIVDTRKTTPGFRTLEKWAVRCGGGRNHRLALFDGILIKDNHIAACGGVKAAVERARARAPHPLRGGSIGRRAKRSTPARIRCSSDNQPPDGSRRSSSSARPRACGGQRRVNLDRSPHRAHWRGQISVGALTTPPRRGRPAGMDAPSRDDPAPPGLPALEVTTVDSTNNRGARGIDGAPVRLVVLATAEACRGRLGDLRLAAGAVSICTPARS